MNLSVADLDLVSEVSAVRSPVLSLRTAPSPPAGAVRSLPTAVAACPEPFLRRFNGAVAPLTPRWSPAIPEAEWLSARPSPPGWN